MAKNIYKSAKGKAVDLDALKLKNETIIAVGNKSVNARGDLLGPGGKIVKSRNELMKDRYSTEGMTEAVPNNTKK
jgi:hypothetical protein